MGISSINMATTSVPVSSGVDILGVGSYGPVDGGLSGGMVHVNNFPEPMPSNQIESVSSMPPRTKRVEMPEIGVDEILAFDWKAFMDGGSQPVPPEDRVDTYLANKRTERQKRQEGLPQELTLEAHRKAQPGPSQPDADKLEQQNKLDVLTQNIAEIKDSIQELRQGQAQPVPQDHAKVVSDALLALTKTGAKRPLLELATGGADVSEKKRIRMQRNRQSAHESRERKRMHTENLEKEVKDLTDQNEQLRNTCETLKLHVQRLEAQLDQLRESRG